MRIYILSLILLTRPGTTKYPSSSLSSCTSTDAEPRNTFEAGVSVSPTLNLELHSAVFFVKKINCFYSREEMNESRAEEAFLVLVKVFS